MNSFSSFSRSRVAVASAVRAARNSLAFSTAMAACALTPDLLEADRRVGLASPDQQIDHLAVDSNAGSAVLRCLRQRAADVRAKEVQVGLVADHEFGESVLRVEQRESATRARTGHVE